ncbi:MAG: 2-phospho-L-lactate transferase [Candidatus Hermodarchaeota archaeon]
MKNNYYLLLAGGVGAAKFIEGLAQIIDPKQMKIIVNTGDDINLYGLNISPDLDIITYTLANVVDKQKGWGFRDETFNCLSILKKYYDFRWFNAGDRDLATHIYRTDLVKQGFTKAEVTNKICRNLGVEAHVIPMCNENVQTYIKTPIGSMHFEEYYIKHKCEPEIISVEFKGIENAKPVDGVIDFIRNAKRIIICPSNPIVSIGTILKVPSIKDILIEERSKVFAISPIVQGSTIKGPADKLLNSLGYDVSSLGVANYYREFLEYFIIDIKDQELKPMIENLGIKTYCFDTIMTNINKKKELARFIININNQ